VLTTDLSSLDERGDTGEVRDSTLMPMSGQPAGNGSKPRTTTTPHRGFVIRHARGDI
jgi:hypothetical protein